MPAAVFRPFIVALLLITLPACAARDTYRLAPPDARSSLQEGDDVIVVLKSGKKYKATVVSLDNEFLVTRGSRYAWQDVHHVTVTKVDAASTVGGFVAVTVIVIGVALMWLYQALDDD